MLEWRIGSSRHTRFWEDCWVGGECLQNKFPRLFINWERKGELVRDMGSWSLEGWR